MRCERWSDADLERLIAAGWGRRSVVASRFRCRVCGGAAEKQVRPPVALASAAVAWI